MDPNQNPQSPANPPNPPAPAAPPPPPQMPPGTQSPPANNPGTTNPGQAPSNLGQPSGVQPGVPPQPAQKIGAPPPPPPAGGAVPPANNSGGGATPPPQPASASNTNPKEFPKKGSPVKIILMILVIILLLGGAGAAAYFYFTNQGGGPDDPVPVTSEEPLVPEGETLTIEYWGLWDDITVYEEVFAEFEAENPGVTINYTLQSPEDYRQRLESALARGEGPDIFRFHNTWVPLLDSHLSTVPAEFYTVEKYQETFYPVISRDMKTADGIVGIPLMIDGLGLYYNKEMFDTAGYTPPTDWEELQAVAEALTITSESGIERAGIPLGLTNNVDNWSDILGLMLIQNGANLADPNDSAGLGRDAMSFYRLFARGEDAVWNSILPNSTAAFAIEKSAMLIAPAWRAHEIVAVNPDIEFGIVPMPQLAESDDAWATYWVEGVSKNVENQRASWALLSYLSEEESLRTMYSAASQVRLFGNPYPRVDMAEQLLGDEYAGAYIQQAPIARSWYMSSHTYDNAINDRVIKYYEDAINGDFRKEELFVTLTNGIQQVLQDYAVPASK